MKYALHSEVTIEAAPERVWEILTDFESYKDWNPFIVSSSGDPTVGARLVNRMQPPGGRVFTFRPTVTAVEEGQVFEWLGHLMVPGLFDGRHHFEVRPSGTGTLFRQDEYFNGVLVRLLRKNLEGPTSAGFHAMNQALKERAEN